jgi:hypothetical protein
MLTLLRKKKPRNLSAVEVISKPIRTADILSACRLVCSFAIVVRTQDIFVLPDFALLP